MTRDTFNSERGRIERTLNMLERSSDQLLAGLPVPTSVLSEAVAFLRATENAAYKDAQNGDDRPVLAGCVEEHVAARLPLAGMESALTGLAAGNRSAAAAFATSARDYVKLWREHVRADDRLLRGRDR